MKFPSIASVAAVVRMRNALPIESTSTEDESDNYIDIRLQVWRTGWRLNTGDAQFDTDHTGYWGSSSVPGNGARINSRAIAKDLLEQARESYRQDLDVIKENRNTRIKASGIYSIEGLIKHYQNFPREGRKAWFDLGTMRQFKTRLLSNLYYSDTDPLIFFCTSEMKLKGHRAYTVRVYNYGTGIVRSHSAFLQYETRAGASVAGAHPLRIAPTAERTVAHSSMSTLKKIQRKSDS